MEENIKRQLIEIAKSYASVTNGGVTFNNPDKYKAFRDGQDSGYSLSLELLETEKKKSYSAGGDAVHKILMPEIERLKELLEQKDAEIKRLKELLEKTIKDVDFNDSVERGISGMMVNEFANTAWEIFKEKHNL